MCDFFDVFDDGEFMNDGFDDGDFGIDMEGSVDPDFDDNQGQEDDQTDGFNWDVAYWSGVGLGFGYEEGKRERRKRRKACSDDPSDID